MALQFFQNKMYSDALHCCTELLANDNSNYSLWYLAGSASFELQDYDLSMNCLYHAISHKSDFDEAYHMLGNIFSIIGETDNALIFWSEAVRINPNSPITLTNMATVYLNKGDLPTAEEYAKKAIEYLITKEKMPRYDVNNIISTIIEKHKAISQYFFDPMIGMKLQKIESEISIDIVKKASSCVFIVLPVFDSFLAPARFEKELFNLMRESYFYYTKKDILIVKKS